MKLNYKYLTSDFGYCYKLDRVVMYVLYITIDWIGDKDLLNTKTPLKKKKKTLRNFVVFLESVFVQLFYILLITFNVPLGRM